ncbi:hypothetical protein FQB35_06815 [Crassaminicella thermophila]|uniref:Uncharacterized protein n=1 Tax=Crassaminicella thermophila TaxID=2599308 RepID=A0A5C0SGM4_CRATE|nr:hypothetical protein [Crassaminicella thermophila]QEK12109.1 hypothetical protein FQB35_06815 [Crassaminicella thermophila]
MKNNILKIYTAIVLIFVILTSFSYADKSKKVVLIVMNEVNYEDLYSMRTIQKLVDNGAIALMNNRTSSKENIYKAYATIGSGVRAEASSNSTSCFNLNDEIKAIYYRRTGVNIPNQGIINIDMPRLIRLNKSGQYGAVPGTLGQSLHDKGMKTAAIGNADTKDNLIRLAPIIAMDHIGYVDYGNIEQDALINDETYPFGFKSNYSKLTEIFRDVYNKSELIVIDIGDLGRLERYKSNLSDEMYLEQKSKILKDVDHYIENIFNVINEDNTRIILVTPYPSSVDRKIGNKLTPVIFYGDGISKGILTSNTTRRIGIIGNVDIAPSIAEYLETSMQNMSGRPVGVILKNNNFDYLMKLNERVVNISQNRYPVLSAFAVFEIFVSIIALIMILIEDKINKRLFCHFKNILLSTMTVPFVMLILPIFHVQNLFITFVILVGLTFIITYVAKKISKNTLDSLIILSFITTFGLLLDICTNANLMKNSLLGYDPIIGARYYGIGNEYMGVLIGSTLVFSTAIIDRFKLNKIWAILTFLITILIIGFPKLGANVGGTITAVAAFAFTALRLSNIKIKLKQFMLIGISVVFVVACMAFIDIKLLKSQSHLAGAIHQIIQSGPGIIFVIIKRKISMNLRLIGITIWSKVLISAIIILATLFYRPVGTIYKLTNLYSNLSIGWSGIIMACIVAFFVNDSGVVAAATGIIFLAMSMLYLTFIYLKENS